MLSDYIAAGFDPAAFWGLTPRLFLIQMRAAGQRDRLMQARSAEAAWIGAHATQGELNSYMDQVTKVSRLLPPEALAGVIRSATSTLPKMTMAEFKKGLQ